jgi:hypothetical protein
LAWQESFMLELNEELFPLTRARKYYPTSDPPSTCTLFRWAHKGVGKHKTKLETVKLGGRRFTNRAALRRFVAQLTGENAVEEELERHRTEAFRTAERECDENRL